MVAYYYRYRYVLNVLYCTKKPAHTWKNYYVWGPVLGLFEACFGPAEGVYSRPTAQILCRRPLCLFDPAATDLHSI